MAIFSEMKQHSMGFSSEINNTIYKDDFLILVFTPIFWRSRISVYEKRQFLKNHDFEPRYLLTPKEFHKGENHF